MPTHCPSTAAASSVLCALIFLLSLFCSATNAQLSLPDSPKPKNTKTQTKEPSESRWPRTFTSAVDTFTASFRKRLTDEKERGSPNRKQNPDMKIVD
jgi:hypothetical protein